jgi:hypothetical protein
MEKLAGCRILAVMGSGETSPTMVTVHRALVARLAVARPRAVLLDTPYAFQEHAADVSQRARAYFARSVGLDVTAIAGPGPTGDGDPGPGGDLGILRGADWVFSGPGSPSYALAHWQGATEQALRDRVAAGEGVTVMASAAAATIGFAALPVYEIYKAGAVPHWLDGLDLLTFLGLHVVLIPHYDNTEGGTHDTRYCYLGERRLSVLERELPAGAAVLGVDEHTAVIFDLKAAVVEVVGRGTLTVRRAGRSTVLPAGTVIPLAQLQALVRHGPASAGGPSPVARAAPPAAAPLPLVDITRAASDRFDAAAGGRDVPAMVTAILDLESAISDWAADTEEDEGTPQARAVLRGLISRLGGLAAEASGSTGAQLTAAVEPLLARSGMRWPPPDS